MTSYALWRCMDISDIQPLVRAAGTLMKPGGRFVFSLCHPCFNSGLARHGMERHDIGGELVEEYFVRVCRYAESMTTKGLAMVGQPVPQFYFHRPLSALLCTFFAERFVLDGLEEPTIGSAAKETKVFDMVYQKIPPVLVARLRLSAT